MKIRIDIPSFHGNHEVMKRSNYINKINEEFKVNPIVALLGPRQCGKTTRAEQYTSTLRDEFHKFDLEDPEDLAALGNPKLLFSELLHRTT